MTDRELQELCGWWQKVLRLQDWDVKVLVKRRFQMPADAQGQVDYVLQNRKAVISVLAAEDYEPDHLWPQDQEKTLVHELIHLHMAPFAAPTGTPQDIAQEQAIEALAGALVRLKRGVELGRDGLGDAGTD